MGRSDGSTPSTAAKIWGCKGFDSMYMTITQALCSIYHSIINVCITKWQLKRCTSFTASETGSVRVR